MNLYLSVPNNIKTKLKTKDIQKEIKNSNTSYWLKNSICAANVRNITKMRSDVEILLYYLHIKEKELIQGIIKEK